MRVAMVMTGQNQLAFILCHIPYESLCTGHVSVYCVILIFSPNPPASRAAQIVRKGAPVQIVVNQMGFELLNR